MEAKHTPGPWFWADSCSYRRLSSQATGHDGDVLHAVVQHSDGHPDVHFPNGGYKGPDARLIAAAPKLLEALQAVLRRFPTDGDMRAAGWEQTEIDLACRDYEAARAAIAKATQ